MDYLVTYSNRRTIAVYVHKDKSVEVKCPKRTSDLTIKKIIEEKKEWIIKNQKKIFEEKNVLISEELKKALIRKAKTIIPNKVKYYSTIMNAEPAKVRIGNATSYWGCCSGKNNINFSWRLMRASDEAINYVVVHELAHIKHHNHGKMFWEEVEKIIPNYKIYKKELKKPFMDEHER